MMESPPTTEAVYQGVYTLYNNTNTVEQEKASKWLEQLQNSVINRIKLIFVNFFFPPMMFFFCGEKKQLT